jgi:anti-sigma regulatory factor (Ser/Thr protein kinase)
MSLERAFPGTMQSIVLARRFAAEALVGIEPDLADTVMVMVSELVTNSVRHAASEFTLSLERDLDSIRVAVSDEGERRPSLRNPTPAEQSGRGLQIVNALCDSWGVTETAGRRGKTVWFVVALHPENRGAEGATSAGRRTVAHPPDVAGGDTPRNAWLAGSKDASRRHPESRAHRRLVCGV